MQSRQFVAQREDLPRDRTIVVLAIVLATAGPRLERLLAQVASLREREKRHDQRTRQRDHGAGAVAPLLRGRACRGAHVLGQAGHVALVLQRQPVVRFVGQDVLAEARRQRGKTLDNGRAAGPGFFGKPRAGTFEIQMYAPQQLQLFRVEDQFAAAAVQVVDAREKRCVEVDGAVMGGKARRHLAFHCLQRRRRFRCGQVEEDFFDPVENTSATCRRQRGCFRTLPATWRRQWQRFPRDANAVLRQTRARSAPDGSRRKAAARKAWSRSGAGDCCRWRSSRIHRKLEGRRSRRGRCARSGRAFYFTRRHATVEFEPSRQDPEP